MSRVRDAAAVLLSVYLGGLAHATPRTQEPVEWRADRPLAWTDFIGPPDASSRAAARTAYEMRTRTRCIGDRVFYEVTVLFLRQQSWVKSRQQLDRTLAHEQGHFDLGEVTARRFRAALGQLASRCDVPDPAFKALLLEFQKQDADLQRSYDRQTQHGVESAPQRQWEARIASWLRDLPS